MRGSSSAKTRFALLSAHDNRVSGHASNTMTLRTVLPAFIAAKPSLISDSFSFAEIQSSRCSLPRM